MLPRYETVPDPSCKEKLPEIRSLGRHPWEITLREFIEIVRRNYGIEIDVRSAARIASRFLRKGNKGLILLLDMDEVLTLSVLGNLCRAYGIPPEDFKLDPEPEED
jgi:hypothetical protein